MDPAVWIVAASAALGLATAFGLRARGPGWVVAGLLAASGAGVGWGGMLLRPAPSAGEVAIAVGGLALLVPAHVRIVLGPLGRRRGARG